MSAQAGMFFFDRRPVPDGLPQWLSATLRLHGPDKQGDCTAPGIVMTHRALVVTSEDSLERQPVRSPQGHAVTWDGRLDNRQDVSLSLGRFATGIRTDAELVSTAYEHWGTASFSRLVGDWSLAIWDAREDQMVLASDYMGIRPLFYYLTPQYLAWSTCLATLVLLSGRYDDLCQTYLAGFLLARPTPDATPYKSILSIPPGCALCVRRTGQTTLVRHWSLTCDAKIEGQPSQYAEQLIELFKSAVRARLRTRGPAWAELSGGMDSSSIVCMANHVLTHDSDASSDAPALLHTASYVHRDVPDSPELPLIHAVEDATQATPHHFETEDGVPQGAVDWVTPDGIPPARLAAHQVMQTMGARVLLAGDIGDDVMGAQTDGFACVLYYLQRHELRRALAEFKAWDRTPASSHYRAFYQIARYLHDLHTPKRWRAGRSTPEPGRMTVDLCTSLYGITPRLARLATDVEHDVEAALPKTADRSKLGMFRAIHDHTRRRILMARERHFTVRPTYPFADRRLVEFMLSIPTPSLARPHQQRSLMLQAFSSFLPEPVANQAALKRLPSPQARKYRGNALSLLREDSLLVVDRGLIDASVLKRRIDALRSGGPMSNLRRVEFLECWLRRRRDLFKTLADQRDLPALAPAVREAGIG